MTSQGQIQEMAGEKGGAQVGAVGETNQARGACVPWREGSLLEAPGRWGSPWGESIIQCMFSGKNVTGCDVEIQPPRWQSGSRTLWAGMRVLGLRWRAGHDRDGGRELRGACEALNGGEQAEDRVQGKTYADG